MCIRDSLNHGMPDPTGMGPKTIAETRTGRALSDPMIFLNMTSVMRRVDPEQAALYDRYAVSYTHLDVDKRQEQMF